jgi:hypothetical protein
LTAPRPRPLVWAVNVIVLQTALELAYVAGRSELTVGLRVGLMVVVAMQFVFARGALRLSAGSVLGLLAFEGMTVVAAIAGDGALVVRGALASVAIAVIVLLMVSIASFPSPDLPKIS